MKYNADIKRLMTLNLTAGKEYTFKNIINLINTSYITIETVSECNDIDCSLIHSFTLENVKNIMDGISKLINNNGTKDISIYCEFLNNFMIMVTVDDYRLECTICNKHNSKEFTDNVRNMIDGSIKTLTDWSNFIGKYRIEIHDKTGPIDTMSN